MCIEGSHEQTSLDEVGTGFSVQTCEAAGFNIDTGGIHLRVSAGEQCFQIRKQNMIQPYGLQFNYIVTINVPENKEVINC